MDAAVLTVASSSSIPAIEPTISYCYAFLELLGLGKTMQMWAVCPFCRRVIEVTTGARELTVDGKRRFACEKCGKQLAPAKPPKAPPAKPNGETVHATQVREVADDDFAEHS
jgi:ribosomal protein L24E